MAGINRTQRKPGIGIVVIMDRQPDLFQVVGALGAPSGFASLLNCGQQQGDQHRDNRDHHQKFNQRESRSRQTGTWHGSLLQWVGPTGDLEKHHPNRWLATDWWLAK